uniref:partner and localizer of BRCA2 n=1 Tax=Semicossyphus pulcher TaxID=241346 RepID=UPI0037E93D76
MESNMGNILHCEDQLKTTLHFDDKEKLRRKLALLQREYLRTAQRLQRAERSEAVRIHVRSRIAQQNHQDQRDPEVTSNPCHNPSSLTLNTTNGTVSGVHQCQEHTGGPAVSGNFRKSQVIRFLLPTDAACPQTPDSSHDAGRGHKSTPALRLRSRRSRLRWERRSAAETGRSTDNSEDGGEQSERMETAGTEGGEERVETAGAEVVNESDELCSSTESESPSLLLTHWNTCGQSEAGNTEGKETQGRQERRGKESESTSLLLKCLDSAIDTERREQHGTQNARREEKQGGEEGGNSGEQMDRGMCEDSKGKNAEQSAAEKKESPDNTVETIEEKSEMAEGELDVNGAGLKDSCTLVEGLLFPAEYYVRTTRRMSSNQIQPDMQAVILSQLNTGQRRRSRGRGRGSNRHTHNNQGSDQHSQSDFSSPTSVSPPVVESPAAGTPAELSSQDQISADACAAPTVTSARPARGRRRRGRGRGRAQTPRCSVSLATHQLDPERAPEDPPPTSTPMSSSPSDDPKPCLTPGEAVPEVAGVYPIFVKSSDRTNRSTPMSTSKRSWRSLLLPSPPPAQTSLLPLPSLSSGALVNNLINFDIPQDFHLPDDQFASLKLQKLRGVAVESGVEHFTSPFYNTRRSIRRSGTPQSPVMPLSLPLSLTPKIANSSHSVEAKQAAAQSKHLEECPNKRPLNEESECQTHVSSTGSVPPVQDRAAGSVDQDAPLLTFADPPTGQLNDNVTVHSEELQIKESSVISSKEQTDSPGVARHVEDQRSTNRRTEDKAIIKTLSFDSPSQKTPEVPSRNRSACNESPVQHHKVKYSDKHAKESPERTRRVHSQLLMSPLLASAPCPIITPHLPSSAAPSSPALPSLGPTPHPVPAAIPLTSSPSAPALTLPPPHSPSTQVLSPPPLSPCLSLSSLHPSQSPMSPCAGQIQAISEPSQRTESATCQPVSGSQEQCSGRQVGVRIAEPAEEHSLRCIHTLKVPAGGRLVDACCLTLPSGGLCVAAAGKWAVCLWTQTAASDWSLTHTWAFKEPVINVFPVPDAAGLMCVTLGQLEIREVRMLSCSSLSQVQLCEGLVQTVVGVSKSRVVTTSHSACGSTLHVFTLSDSGSTWSSRPLVSPGVCVGALAPVDGLSDALIGTDEGGHLFIWNLKTGQLLQRIILTDGLAHTACLRGYSYCGVLFVLLQHQLLSSLEEEERKAAAKEEEKKKTALFALVAVNPLSGKSVLATRLYPPKAWSGRLCEADVYSSSVVGLSQTGCVCVWELGRKGARRMVWAPESEGWQLAQWGGGGTLVTGHHNGDISLHGCSLNQTSL